MKGKVPEPKTERDAKLIKMLRDHPTWTQRGVAKRFKISPGRVTQIKRKYDK